MSRLPEAICAVCDVPLREHRGNERTHHFRTYPGPCKCVECQNDVLDESDDDQVPRNTVYVQDRAPVEPAEGDVWWVDRALYRWEGGQWVPVAEIVSPGPSLTNDQGMILLGPPAPQADDKAVDLDALLAAILSPIPWRLRWDLWKSRLCGRPSRSITDLTPPSDLPAPGGVHPDRLPLRDHLRRRPG